MPAYPEPHLLTFARLGDAAIGFLSVSEQAEPPVPFVVRRVFWTYHVPGQAVRGRHAHRSTEHVLLAVAGHITVTVESTAGVRQVFELRSPHVGLYMPPSVWHTMQYSAGAVQLALASQPYAEEDYLSDNQQFKDFWQPHQP